MFDQWLKIEFDSDARPEATIVCAISRKSRPYIFFHFSKKKIGRPPWSRSRPVGSQRFKCVSTEKWCFSYITLYPLYVIHDTTGFILLKPRPTRRTFSGWKRTCRTWEVTYWVWPNSQLAGWILIRNKTPPVKTRWKGIPIKKTHRVWHMGLGVR